VNPASSVMNVEAHFDPEEGELAFKSMFSWCDNAVQILRVPNWAHACVELGQQSFARFLLLVSSWSWYCAHCLGVTTTKDN
jgi:hypothetical protein